MAAKSIFEQIESRFSSVPLVRSKNVFLGTEYAKHCGLKTSMARERLRRLVAEGSVRKVRTPRDGTIKQAWEFIGKSSE